MERIIGSYQGVEEGCLILVFAGIHGNEHAGIKALEELFLMLEKEPIQNPGFNFKGKLIGVRGNLKAIREKKRYLSKDLNRQWRCDNIDRVKNAKLDALDAEDLELRMLVSLVDDLIAENKPQEIVFLDLHTTTADGGFSVVTDDPISTQLAKSLYAPVIKGLLNGVKGTSLHYFTTENLGVKTSSLCFESGQHDDPYSVNRAVSALVSLLRAVGAIDKKDVEHKHDQLLKDYAKYLPVVTELVTMHSITDEDEFLMKPGYKNFDTIKRGEILAEDKNGLIKSPCDGFILMPLYQKQGSDGFFIVREVL